MIEVSVVIPTKDRSHCIERAIKSVYSQTIKEIEIIIVDDASTDNTPDIIREIQKKSNIPIKYLRNDVSVGGAVARNQGANVSVGRYIAFLDSDDEWLPNHLSSGIDLIESSKSSGVFGNFYTNINGELRSHNNIAKPEDMNMADYIFSRMGDSRTSTFIFNLSDFKNILFDEKQKKHQDWDLAIRFDSMYKLTLNNEKTVIIHYDSSNRMSGSLNHEATDYLIRKHLEKAKPKSFVNFYLYLMSTTLKMEGKTSNFINYQKKLNLIIKNNNLPVTLKQRIKIYIYKYLTNNMIRCLLYRKK